MRTEAAGLALRPVEPPPPTAELSSPVWSISAVMLLAAVMRSMKLRVRRSERR